MARAARGAHLGVVRRADREVPGGRGAVSAEEIATALKNMVVSGDLFPVTCGAATRNSGTRALLDLIVEGLPSPKRAGPVHARHADGEEIEIDLEDGTVVFVFKTIADPFAGKLEPVPRLRRAHHRRHDADRHPHPRQGALRGAARGAGQGAPPDDGARPGRDRRRGQAQGRADRRPAARPRARRRRRPGRAARARRVRGRGAGAQGRGREARHVAAAPARGGPDARGAPRRAHRRDAGRGPLADARRGHARPPQAPLRRRGRDAPAARAVPGGDPQGRPGPRPAQEAVRRPRPVRRLPHPDRAAAGPRGLRVRRQDRRRRDPAELPRRRSTRASRSR